MSATPTPRAVFLDALSLGDVDLAPLQRWCDLQCWPSTTAEQRLERLQAEGRAVPTVVRELLALDGAAAHEEQG